MGRVRWFADLQARQAHFRYEPDPNAGVTEREVTWNFVNPKGGVTVQLADGLSAFASYGATTREPARSDLFAGDDDLNTGNVDVIGDFHRVHPESVRDVEVGIDFRRADLELQVNAYDMEFSNSIERIGAPTASGLVPRRNVGAAYRRGLELDASWRAADKVLVGANAWVSANRIRSFTDSTVDPVVLRRNVEPLLTPAFVSTQRVEFSTIRSLTLGIEGRYQSRAFLDNTDNDARTLPATYLLDASARLSRSRYALVVRGTNLGNNRKYGSGSVSSSGEVRYFVLGGRSLFTTLEIGF
jgi:iron complex outermembrane receptor protein